MGDLTRISDLGRSEIEELLDSALAAKADPGSLPRVGEGRSVAILFEKPSLRTRFSLEAALVRLGAHPIGAYDREIGLGSREPLVDAARVLERYVAAIVIRTFEHTRVDELAEASSVPVVNALSDDHHPLQALADLMTVTETHCGGDPRKLGEVKIAYLGDGNNVAHSLIEACGLFGARIAIACPEHYAPDPSIVSWARDGSAEVDVTPDPYEAVQGADVVYTDVWTSMGQEAESSQRRSDLEAYRVTADLMSKAATGAIFLHCLPAHRGEEVDADVIDGAASRVFDQAENRMHTALAVFRRIFEGR